jgi:hypothetical protein
MALFHSLLGSGLNNLTGGKDSPQAMKASLEVGQANRVLYSSHLSQFPDY